MRMSRDVSRDVWHVMCDAGNDIGDGGTTSLAVALKDNSTLGTLRLGRACSRVSVT